MSEVQEEKGKADHKQSVVIHDKSQLKGIHFLTLAIAVALFLLIINCMYWNM